jgi:hypothetical protein
MTNRYNIYRIMELANQVCNDELELEYRYENVNSKRWVLYHNNTVALMATNLFAIKIFLCGIVWSGGRFDFFVDANLYVDEIDIPNDSQEILFDYNNAIKDRNGYSNVTLEYQDNTAWAISVYNDTASKKTSNPYVGSFSDCIAFMAGYLSVSDGDE